jgi:hypothetical protein
VPAHREIVAERRATVLQRFSVDLQPVLMRDGRHRTIVLGCVEVADRPAEVVEEAVALGA